jgi:uncharacterized coiled-coil protein SlyX
MFDQQTIMIAFWAISTAASVAGFLTLMSVKRRSEANDMELGSLNSRVERQSKTFTDVSAMWANIGDQDRKTFRDALAALAATAEADKMTTVTALEALDGDFRSVMATLTGELKQKLEEAARSSLISAGALRTELMQNMINFDKAAFNAQDKIAAAHSALSSRVGMLNSNLDEIISRHEVLVKAATGRLENLETITSDHGGRLSDQGSLLASRTDTLAAEVKNLYSNLAIHDKQHDEVAGAAAKAVLASEHALKEIELLRPIIGQSSLSVTETIPTQIKALFSAIEPLNKNMAIAMGDAAGAKGLVKMMSETLFAQGSSIDKLIAVNKRFDGLIIDSRNSLDAGLRASTEAIQAVSDKMAKNADFATGLLQGVTKDVANFSIAVKDAQASADKAMVIAGNAESVVNALRPLEATVTRLETRQALSERTLGAVSGKFAGFEFDIKTISDQLRNVNVTALEVQYDELTASIGRTNSVNVEMSGTVLELSKKFGDYDSDLAALGDDLSALEDTVEALSLRNDNAATQLDAVASTLDATSKVASAAYNGVADANNKITDVKMKVDTDTNNLMVQFNSALKGIYEAIDSMAANVANLQATPPAPAPTGSGTPTDNNAEAIEALRTMLEALREREALTTSSMTSRIGEALGAAEAMSSSMTSVGNRLDELERLKAALGDSATKAHLKKLASDVQNRLSTLYLCVDPDLLGLEPDPLPQSIAL